MIGDEIWGGKKHQTFMQLTAGFTQLFSMRGIGCSQGGFWGVQEEKAMLRGNVSPVWLQSRLQLAASCGGNGTMGLGRQQETKSYDAMGSCSVT